MPDQEWQFLAALRAKTITSAVEGLAEAGETEAARELLEGGAFGGELGPEKTRRLLSRIAKIAKEKATETAQRAATEKARRAFELQVRVASGVASQEEVDQALQNKAIGAEQHARFIEELERQAEDRRRRTAGIERIAALLARGEKPDPSNPAHRQAVEAHFESIAGAFAQLSPEDRAMAEDLYVQQTGVLPTAIKNALLGGLLSSEPSAQMAAAQRLVKLEKADSAVSEGIPEALRARAQALAAFALPGVKPEIAGNTPKIPITGFGPEDPLHAIVTARHGLLGGRGRAWGRPDGIKALIIKNAVQGIPALVRQQQLRPFRELRVAADGAQRERAREL